MLGSILIGLAIVAIIVIIAYLATHHKQPATVAGADLANTLASASSDAWEAVKRDLPSIVSADLAQAKADLATALQDAQALREKLAATIAAHAADKAAVAARVAAAVSASPELPPSTLAPAVEAQDAARVEAFADQISPGASALT